MADEAVAGPAEFTKVSPGEVYENPKDLGEFKDLVKKAYKKGCRLIGITALDAAEKIELIYHFDSDKHILYHIRFFIDPEVEHVSVLEMFPSAFLYENEICELMGMKIKGIQGKLLLAKDMEGMHPLRKSFKIEEMLIKLQGAPEPRVVRPATEEDRLVGAAAKAQDLKEGEVCESDEDAVAEKKVKDAKKAKAPKADEEKDGDA